MGLLMPILHTIQRNRLQFSSKNPFLIIGLHRWNNEMAGDDFDQPLFDNEKGHHNYFFEKQQQCQRQMCVRSPYPILQFVCLTSLARCWCLVMF